MDAITFRLAEPDDLDEIVTLSEGIYQGHDSPPLMFHKWLRTKNMAVILAQSSDNKLIGLIAYFIIDDRQTFVRRFERIHQDLSGQGLVRKLREYARNHAKQRFPNLKRVRFTSTNGSVNFQYHRKLLELNILEYEVKLKSCSQALAAMKKSIVIKPCSRKYISDVILSSTERAQLFPEDIILFNWVPFERLRSNIDHILEDCNELFAEDCVDDSIPRSISFGTYLPTEKFLDWRTAIYSDDPTLFEAHLLHQLNRACEFIKSDFVFVCFHDKRWTELTKKVIEEQLQLNVYHHYVGQGKMYLYEKEFTR